ncbi:MAG: ribokinase [Alphaproteobacteria bacterium]|nr:ribokinase [Alphaproteobacteria bacterium]MCW5739897.1 ribokinase [Alphaproteobacteria bacterium]
MDLVAEAPSLPLPGETVMGSAFHTLPGGKGLNQAVAAARLGASVAMIGCVGHDAFGARLLEVIEADGVDASGVRRTGEAPTGIAQIVVSRGENSIVVVPGANMSMTDADISSVDIADGDVVVAQLETPVAVSERLFARARNATTILNAAPAATVPNSLLALTDVLVVNETELATLSNARLSEDSAVAEIVAAAQSLRRANMAVIVTLGRRGALLLRGDAPPQTVGGRAVNAVDSTGAGDCFVGAYAAALATARPGSALAFANAAAALAVTRRGAAPAMPRLAEVVALMRA